MADRNGYIGRAPADSSVTLARQVFTPSGSQTTFTFSAGYDVGYLDVFVNGTKLISGSDYQATTGTTVDLSAAAQSGDSVELIAYKKFNLTQVVSSTTGDLSVGGNLSVSGTYSGTGTGLSGIVTSLVAGDHISLSGSTGQVTITGITTANVVTDSLEVKGTTQLNGNVTLDADLDLQDSDKILIGTGDDLQIFHNGTDSNILGSTGDLYIQNTGGSADDINIRAQDDINLQVDNGEAGIDIIGGGSVILYHHNNARVTTTDDGVTVTGNVTGVNATFSGNVSVGGTLTYEDVTNVDSVGIVTAQTGIKVLAGGANIVGVVTADEYDGYYMLDNSLF